jgi:phosphohistidine phosphatase
MAAYLKSNNFEIDFIVSSTANRAIMTANAFQMEFGIETKRFWTDPDLYHSSPDTIVLSLCQIPPEFTNIAVFAHNPGMTLLANKVSEEYIENIPTCGVNVCATSKPLCDISIDDLSMTHLFTPKSIDR